MMKFTIVLFSCLILTSCALDPCGNKDEFLKDFDTFVQETRDASKNDEDINWSSFDKKFEQYTKDCYQLHKEELDLSEKRIFWKDAMVAYFVRNGKDAFEKLNDEEGSNDYISTELEEVFKGSGEELEAVFKDFLKNEMPDLIDEAVKGIEKFGEQLKELLKETK